MDEATITPVAEDRFERIGTTYYKIVRQPNAARQLIERSIPWTIEAIRQDYGGCCRTPYKKIKQKPQLSQAEAFLCPQNFVILWYSN